MKKLAGIMGLLLGLAVLSGAFPAAALETGTRAWTIEDVTLYEGPGRQYDVVGDVEGEIEIRVERCSYDWCRIRSGGERGWVGLSSLSFGQHPRGPFTGPEFEYGRGGPGQVCLFTGPDYTGEAVCHESGFVSPDLLLYHQDDVFSSVSVEGNVSVTVCRDRHFSSYCELVSKSTPRLHGFLDNNVSSIRVY